METPSTTPSPLPVIPPIITCEKDRLFLINLNSRIDHDLNNIDRGNKEQRYLCYKAAFERIIDYVDAYKPLLTATKAEYEDCIETIKHGRQEAFYLTGKLKALASEPSTIRNYRKRADELEQKMEVIDADNERLSQQLAELKAMRAETDTQSNHPADNTPRKVTKRDLRPIPGLTLQQSTDVRVLGRELEKLERQLRELSIAHRTRYSPAQVKDHLKGQLEHKVTLRDQLAEELELMKTKRYKLKIAVEAAQAYLKIQPPHQTIGDAVVAALIRDNNHGPDKGAEDMAVRGTPSTTFEDDDPTREKEAEMMLEYIEKFNELLEDGHLEEAAVHAANSPKGILRTPETLARFKDLGCRTSEGRSPLLAFCEALMATVQAYGMKPTEFMSTECVRCALDENRPDLLVHWVAQDRLSLTDEIGQMVYEWCMSRPMAKRYLSLVHTIYKAVGAHVPAVVCMVDQGRVEQAADYARNQVKFTIEEYIEVIQKCPNLHLARTLLGRPGHGTVPLGVLLKTLMKAGASSIWLKLIADIEAKSTQDGKLEMLRQAVEFDTMTTLEEWIDITQHLQHHGIYNAALKILASATVNTAVREAMKSVKEDEEHEPPIKLQLSRKSKSKKDTVHIRTESESTGKRQLTSMQEKLKKDRRMMVNIDGKNKVNTTEEVANQKGTTPKKITFGGVQEKVVGNQEDYISSPEDDSNNVSKAGQKIEFDSVKVTLKETNDRSEPDDGGRDDGPGSDSDQNFVITPGSKTEDESAMSTGYEADVE